MKNPMDKQPTEAHQDELAGIREKIARLIRDYTNQQLTMVNTGIIPNRDALTSEGQATRILSLTLKRGGGVCPKCKGDRRRRILSFPQDQVGRDGGICAPCNGTGESQPFTIADAIRDKLNG